MTRSPTHLPAHAPAFQPTSASILSRPALRPRPMLAPPSTGLSPWRFTSWCLSRFRRLSAAPWRRLAAVLAAVVLALGAAGCSSVDVATYAKNGPPFALERYFDGLVDAHGMVQDRSGRVIRRFVVTLEGRWQGDEGVLDEQFVYDDGERQKRIWRIRRLGDGRYSGAADDVVGTADGNAAGNALNWRYTMALPVDGRVWHIDFDDWMYLIDERVLLNRAVMSKFGIRVGEITLSFTKRGTAK